MINEDYVSFETAKLLKEKGFEIPYDSFRGVYVNGEFKRLNPGNAYGYNSKDEIIEVCSLQLAMKWLREEKGIPVEILWHYDADSDVEEWYFIHHAELRILPNDIEYYETYEEATEVAIKYCLENLI